MDLGLRGRAAIVEASSEGIGKAIAFSLAREGSNLLICARRRGPLDETAEVIRTATGVRVAAVAADVTDEHAAKDLVAHALGEYGRLDISVTNAGGPPSKGFSDTTAEDWRKAVDLNLLSAVWLAREALPVMQRAGWGRFITLTSVSVKQPLSGLILSNSVRTAVNGLVRSLCNEYGATGVTVNNVCPGFTATERLVNSPGNSGRVRNRSGSTAFLRGDWQPPRKWATSSRFFVRSGPPTSTARPSRSTAASRRHTVER